MRADRLVAILILLQTRGQVTATQVATELEVSERTARRDLGALGIAGLPIYSRPGRNGGWQLLGGGRTDLSGLSAPEARALFLTAGPLSTTPELRAALRKLMRALPEPFRADAEAASTAVVLDSSNWGHTARAKPAPVHLDALQRAVVEAQQVVLGYVARDSVPSTRTVHPLGLAAKGPIWYLIAETDAGLRSFRVDRVTSVDPTGSAAVRPAGFNLDEAWRMIVEKIDERRTPVHARAKARPEILAWCRGLFGTRLRMGPPDTDGLVDVELRGHSIEALAVEIAGFGAAIEIIEPEPLRQQLANIGAELTAVYTERGECSGSD